jgi:hypothetical protein
LSYTVKTLINLFRRSTKRFCDPTKAISRGFPHWADHLRSFLESPVEEQAAADPEELENLGSTIANSAERYKEDLESYTFSESVDINTDGFRNYNCPYLVANAAESRTAPSVK